jgi:hypothetical protein
MAMRRGAGREAGVVREVVDQLTGSGSAEDDLLDAGVEAVEVEDANSQADSAVRAAAVPINPTCRTTSTHHY